MKKNNSISRYNKQFTMIMCLLLSFTHFSILGQSKLKKIDSLRQILTKKVPDSTRANILYQLGNPYTIQDNVDSAQFYSNKLLKLGKSIKSNFWKARAIKLLGDSYIKKGDYEQSTLHHKQALNLIQKVATNKGRKTEVAIKINLLIAYSLWEKYDQALKVGLPLLKSNEKDSLTKRNEEFIFRYLGNVYLGLNDKEKAMGYYRKAIAIPLEDQDLRITLSLANVNNLIKKEEYVSALELLLPIIDVIQKKEIENIETLKAYKVLNSIYDMNGEHEKTLFFYDKMIEIAKKKNQFAYLIVALNGKSGALKKLNKYKASLDFALQALEAAKEYNFKSILYNLSITVGYRYMHLKDYKNAMTYFKEGLEAAIRGKDNVQIANAYTSLGESYLKLKKFKEARTVFEKSKRLFQEEKKNSMSNSNLLLYYESIAIIDSAQGRYKSSLSHYKRYISLKDSMEFNDQKEKLKELELSYKTEKKDKEIKLLSADNELQKLKAEKEKNIKVGLIIGGVLSLLFLGITYNRYRVKRKAITIIGEQKKALEKKNHENQLLVKEIHHRVKNNLQIILSLLNAQLGTSEEDKKANEVIIESQNKIKSMALIHQNLYNTESFVNIPTSTYFKDLINHIRGSYSNTDKCIGFTTNIEDLEIKMTLAVPLGLIINELITNAYKYAFDHSKKDKNITINFSKTEKEATYALEVFDNGSGLPKNFNLDTSESFGLQMVKGLVSQLEGEMFVRKGEGVGFDIYIRDPEAA